MGSVCTIFVMMRDRNNVVLESKSLNYHVCVTSWGHKCCRDWEGKNGCFDIRLRIWVCAFYVKREIWKIFTHPELEVVGCQPLTRSCQSWHNSHYWHHKFNGHCNQADVKHWHQVDMSVNVDTRDSTVIVIMLTATLDTKWCQSLTQNDVKVGHNMMSNVVT